MRIYIFILSFVLISSAYAQVIDSTHVAQIIESIKNLEQQTVLTKLNPSEKNLAKLSAILKQRHLNHTSDSLSINNYIALNMEAGTRCNSQQKIDSALVYYRRCEKILSSVPINIVANYNIVYKYLFNISFQNKLPHANRYFLLSINNENNDVEDLISFSRINKNVSKDSLLTLLHIMNTNYLNNKIKSPGDVDILFRYIIFMDQYFRVKCYDYKTIKYDAVQENDSLLQLLFISVLKNYNNLNMFDGSYYQRTFDLLLIHSVSGRQTTFFDNYFKIYSQPFNNDFKKYNTLKSLIDIYLKFKYNSQYFGTEFGQGELPDKKWGLLTKMKEEDFISVLKKLKINNATYK